MKKVVMLSFMMLLMVAAAMAQNDPGHDTLYIEEQGDSELNGTFNVTENQTVKGGEVEIDNQFEIRGNGVIPATNTNFIVGSHDNYISINSKGNGRVIKLQDQIGSGGAVLIGEGNSIDLNVTNNLHVFGSLLSIDTNFEIRTDGTFPGTGKSSLVANGTTGSRQLWLTAEDIYLGSSNNVVHVGRTTGDSVLLNVTGHIEGLAGANFTSASYIAGSQICTAGNGLCTGSGNATASGWNDTGTNVVLLTASDNVAIGAASANEKLHVQGDVYISQQLLPENGTASNPAYNFWNSGNTGMYLPDIYDLGFSTNGTERLRIDSLGNVGIGASSPSMRLHVNGSANITGTSYVNGGQICTDTNGLCSGGSGSSPWTNTSTQVHLANGYPTFVNASSTLYVNGTSGRVGVGTETPATELDVNGNVTLQGGGIYDSGGSPRIEFTTSKVIINLG